MKSKNSHATEVEPKTGAKRPRTPYYRSTKDTGKCLTMPHYCLSAEISGLQVRVLPGSPLFPHKRLLISIHRCPCYAFSAGQILRAHTFPPLPTWHATNRCAFTASSVYDVALARGSRRSSCCNLGFSSFSCVQRKYLGVGNDRTRSRTKRHIDGILRTRRSSHAAGEDFLYHLCY